MKLPPKYTAKVYRAYMKDHPNTTPEIVRNEHLIGEVTARVRASQQCEQPKTVTGRYSTSRSFLNCTKTDEGGG